ncbi:hypothetical protein [Roseisolibacter agri]|nr:hypothetical protein [Roseisolibacter agri]
MRARTLLSTATLLASAACMSVPKPETAPAPAVSTGEAPGLAVWSSSSTGLVGTTAAGTTYFTTDRDGYAAAFAVTRDGRLRVVWPESPEDRGVVRAGKTYRANGSFAQYGAWLTGARNAVPYVFVLVSDERPDLSRFGSGSKWKYQVTLDKLGRDAEDAIQSVASIVLPGPDASYAADYSYISPRLSGQAQMLALYCGVRNTDARNYDYFRDLWATFDPWDNTLGAISFASAWNFWPGSLFPFGTNRGSLAFYADRASRASAAFWGGCPAFTPFRSLAYRQQFAYGVPTVVQPYALAQPPVSAQPLSPTMQAPGTPAPVDDGSGNKPGDRLRVKPSPIFGGPGIEAIGGTDARAERQARFRDQMETRRQERGLGERAMERGALARAERLERVDVGRLETRVQMLDRVERGLAPSERGAGRAGTYGRAGRFGDDGFGGRGMVGVPRGVERGLSDRSSSPGVVGAARSDGGTGSAPQANPGSRTEGGESRGGTVSEAKSRTP